MQCGLLSKLYGQLSRAVNLQYEVALFDQPMLLECAEQVAGKQ